MESRIRDLARQIRAVAADHIAYSQVAEFMNHVDAHLAAIAFTEEASRRYGILEERVGRLEKTVAHLCLDKSDDV